MKMKIVGKKYISYKEEQRKVLGHFRTVAVDLMNLFTIWWTNIKMKNERLRRRKRDKRKWMEVCRIQLGQGYSMWPISTRLSESQELLRHLSILMMKWWEGTRQEQCPFYYFFLSIFFHFMFVSLSFSLPLLFLMTWWRRRTSTRTKVKCLAVIRDSWKTVFGEILRNHWGFFVCLFIGVTFPFEFF